MWPLLAFAAALAAMFLFGLVVGCALSANGDEPRGGVWDDVDGM